MITTPHLAVDGIVEVLDAQGKVSGVVLIERRNPPHGWALPGGFVDVGERVETALVREMQEEISVRVDRLQLLGVYSDPQRDPRGHTVAIVYVCQTSDAPIAADDAKHLSIFPIGHWPSTLAFDHADILQDYLDWRNSQPAD